MMKDKEKAGDEHMGKFVYCSQHLNPHETGWCTVSPDDKLGLHVETYEDAVRKCKRLGLQLYSGSAFL